MKSCWFDLADSEHYVKGIEERKDKLNQIKLFYDCIALTQNMFPIEIQVDAWDEDNFRHLQKDNNITKTMTIMY